MLTRVRVVALIGPPVGCAGPGQYTCGPEGRGGLTGQPGGGPRVGPPGAPFAVGASFKGKPTESGERYLCIGGSPWNCESSGSDKISASVTTP
ncbi:MAG: hypothetical protein ACKODX_10680 [Gemmata sp.]